MAKVTLIFEDSEKDGEPSLKVRADYGDVDPKNPTPAAIYAQEVMDAFGMIQNMQESSQSQPLYLVPNKDPNETLN